MSEAPDIVATSERPDAADPLRFTIGRETLESIAADARAAFPEECCGLLVGRLDATGGVVSEHRPSPNVHEGDRRRGYQIEPQLVMDALLEGRTGGRRLIGFYHSHPDGTAAPSRTDAHSAWPDKLYLIQGIAEGLACSATAWVFDQNEEQFLEATLRVSAAKAIQKARSERSGIIGAM